MLVVKVRHLVIAKNLRAVGDPSEPEVADGCDVANRQRAVAAAPVVHGARIGSAGLRVFTDIQQRPHRIADVVAVPFGHGVGEDPARLVAGFIGVLRARATGCSIANSTGSSFFAARSRASSPSSVSAARGYGDNGSKLG